MTSRSMFIAFALAATLVPGVADAGMSFHLEVSIGDDFAAGTLAAVRASDDGIQHIGCHVVASSIPTNGDDYVACVAFDAAGAQAMCVTFAPNLVATARAIDSESYLRFSWNKEGMCTGLVVFTGSWSKP
jgi:hypothetical protein